MNQQLLYVTASYGIGIFSCLGLIFWIRRRRLHALHFLKQSFLMQDYESNSKK